MNESEFKVMYEQEAEAEYRAHLRRSADDLVADVRAGRFGQCYQLWRAIARRATLAQAGPALIEVLRGEADYLVRYHAGAALLKLLGEAALKPAELAIAGRMPKIDALERVMQDRVRATD